MAAASATPPVKAGAPEAPEDSGRTAVAFKKNALDLPRRIDSPIAKPSIAVSEAPKPRDQPLRKEATRRPPTLENSSSLTPREALEGEENQTKKEPVKARTLRKPNPSGITSLQVKSSATLRARPRPTASLEELKKALEAEFSEAYIKHRDLDLEPAEMPVELRDVIQRAIELHLPESLKKHFQFAHAKLPEIINNFYQVASHLPFAKGSRLPVAELMSYLIQSAAGDGAGKITAMHAELKKLVQLEKHQFSSWWFREIHTRSVESRKSVVVK